MQSVLFRRIPRELKNNPVKYFFLFFLLVVSIYVVSSFVISYDSAISMAEKTASDNVVEDGEFQVFIPLTDTQLKHLYNMGATVEKEFYLDVSSGDMTYRVTKIRNNINKITVDKGRLPVKDSEVMLEIRFAEFNGYKVGDTFRMNGRKYRVCGIGYSPDYDYSLKNLSDATTSFENFGIVYMSPHGYDTLNNETSQVEIYNYAFLLGDKLTYQQLKDSLINMDFDYSMVNDKYYLQTVAEATAQQQKVLDALDSLYSGAGQLTDGLDKLNSASSQIATGAGAIKDGAYKLSAGLTEIAKNIAVVNNGINSAKDKLAQLSSEDGLIVQYVNEFVNESFVTASKAASAYFDTAVTFDQSNYRAVLDTYKTQKNATYIDYTETLLDYIIEYSADVSKYVQGVDELIAGNVQINNFTNQLLNAEQTASSSAALLSEKLNVLYNGIDQLSSGLDEAHAGSQKLYSSIGTLDTYIRSSLESAKNNALDNLAVFLKKDSNPRILASAKRASAFKTMILLLGVIVIILVSYILSVFVVQQLGQDIKNIGALYALGVTKSQLMAYYTALPAIISSFGCLLGMLVSIWPLRIKAPFEMLRTAYALSDPVYSVKPYLVIGCVILPPLIAIVINAMSVNKYLSRTALSLLNNEQPKRKVKKVHISRHASFLRMFQTRQISREARTYRTVVFGLINSIMVLTLAICIHYLGVYVQGTAINDMKYNYMYIYKYPSTQLVSGGEACYYKSMQFEKWGKTSDFSVFGIGKNDVYFPAKTGTGPNSMVVSSAVAAKYNIKKGDRVILTDASTDTDYVFYISDICSYNSGLAVFMDINSMRTMFSQKDDYYNMVLSKDALNIPKGRLYSTATKQQFAKSAAKLCKQMKLIENIVLVAGFLILFLTLYILMGVVIDRSSYAISLMKIMGYNKKEISKLFLDGNFYVIIAGIILGIPISMYISRLMLRFSLMNFSIGLDFTVPWAVYLQFFAIVLGVFVIICTMLVRQMNRIPLTEALKGRG